MKRLCLPMGRWLGGNSDVLRNANQHKLMRLGVPRADELAVRDGAVRALGLQTESTVDMTVPLA